MATYEGLPEVFAPSVAAATGDIKPKPSPTTLNQQVQAEGLNSVDPRVLLGDKLPAPIRNLIEAREEIQQGMNAPASSYQVGSPYSSRQISDTPTRLPGDKPESTTNQLGGLIDVLRDEVEQRGRRQDRITSDEYLDAAMLRRQQELAYATNLLSKAQMGQMREKTRRDVLDGWRKIQQEKIRANTVMATALMNTSILAATPNTGVIQALSGPTQAAIQAFQPGQAVN